jgi:hypothetical protein
MKIKDDLNEYQKINIERYQCPGCVVGGDIDCYECEDTYGIQCTRYVCGTMIVPIVGKIFLGMPKGFCRLGEDRNQKIQIFNDYKHLKEGWTYGTYNVPVWKYKDEHENILIRGLSPRINKPFLHIILEDCFDEIDCIEITEDEINEMD